MLGSPSTPFSGTALISIDSRDRTAACMIFKLERMVNQYGGTLVRTPSYKFGAE